MVDKLPEDYKPIREINVRRKVFTSEHFEKKYKVEMEGIARLKRKFYEMYDNSEKYKKR